MPKLFFVNKFSDLRVIIDTGHGLISKLSKMPESLLVNRSYKFSLDIIKLYLTLKADNEFIIAQQLLKSATSIGANIEEAMAAISKRDFIAKMSISSKEARETKYWLRLIKDSKLVEYELDTLLNESNELIKMLCATVKTAQRNLRKS